MSEGAEDDRPEQEELSGEPEPADDEQPAAAGDEGERDSSALGAEKEADSSVDAEPEDVPPETDQAPGDVVPAEIYSVSVPFLGQLPFRTFVVIVCLALVVFVGVLAGSVQVLRSRAPARVARATARPQPEEGTAQPEGAPAEPDLPLGYDALMGKAERMATAGDYAEAARFYRAACEKEDTGVADALFGRYKLSTVLPHLGRYGEAVRICESLRSVSRPGDELWKHALITSTRALSGAEEWEEFWRHLYLLRANSARYSDEMVLNRWLAYMRAMARTRLFLGQSEGADLVYGIKPPPFGSAPSGCRPLMLEDIIVTTGKYGDGTLRASFDTGELHLLSEAASLADVLRAVEQATGLEIECGSSTDHPVVACLEAIAPQHALEMVLGSLGLQAGEQDGRLVVQPLTSGPDSDDEALKAALWGLQEFMILFPESTHLPEAYYAFAHVYMTQDRKNMALDQLQVLCEEFPDSIWSLYGHYVAGRAYAELQDWARAEAELLLVVDTPVDHPLRPSGFFWVAQCQVELEKYTEAVSCFRRALAHEASDPMVPRVLYDIAYCLERSGATPLEVQERYLEVRTRFPETKYARQADYRSARMALNAGQYSAAVRRYEFYLTNWAIEGEEARDACRDLVEAYLGTGELVRAALLGEVMCASFGHTPQYWEAMPMLLEAYEQAGLRGVALPVIDRSLEAAREPSRRWSLSVQKARFLVDLARYDEALSLLERLEGEVQDEELLHGLRLQKARVFIAQEKAEEGLELCRRVALMSTDEATRVEALRITGGYYRTHKQFDEAVLAFSGRCPVSPKGGVQ